MARKGHDKEKSLKSSKNILDLPFELLVGEILAQLRLTDVAQMARVCRRMHQLCVSEYLWQRKFWIDFFPFRQNALLLQQKYLVQQGEGTATSTSTSTVVTTEQGTGQAGGRGGWKRIYQAMDRMEVYTWGILETSAIRSDAMPRMLTRPQNVVQLAAGRQVVLARDVHGQIWQWCRENKAVKVILGRDRPILHHDDKRRHHHHHHPVPTASVHAKGTHAITTAINAIINRDDDNAAGPVQQGRARTSDPVDQISAGWDICAALTRSGRLFAWEPSQLDERHQQQQQQHHHYYSICVQNSVSLKEQGSEGHEAAMAGDKFAQIAVGTDYVIAVTLLGRVYVLRLLDSPHYRGSSSTPSAATDNPQQRDDRVDRIERIVEIRGRILGDGLYLPIFSEALSRTITATYEEYDQWERRQRHHQRTLYPCPSIGYQSCSSLSALSSSSYRPTIVSANSENFALHHSSGKVLLGKYDVQADTRPIVLERFHSNASQLAFGEHHQGLLTEDGQLRTWGSFCEGALGQGDLRSGCAIPTVVDGPLKNKIVVAIGMAGWQSACLAIDLNEEQPYHDFYSRDQGVLVDDGYFSMGSTSSRSSSSGNASSSEGFESSDSEEWMNSREGSFSSFTQDRRSSWSVYTLRESISGSSPSTLVLPAQVTFTPSLSSWESRTTSYLPHQSSCSESCSCSRNYTSSTALTTRPWPAMRRRSSSLAEKHPEDHFNRNSHHYHHRHHHHHHGHHHGQSRDDYKMRMLALTRLNPILTVYEPATVSSSEMDTMTRRFSVF
ncbi:hypothetical protein BGX34_009827 [Mortierella sp. NVP85]|nr:hypothetical protein BGX34_009827 [Mortierella sp. NVP85]